MNNKYVKSSLTIKIYSNFSRMFSRQIWPFSRQFWPLNMNLSNEQKLDSNYGSSYLSFTTSNIDYGRYMRTVDGMSRWASAMSIGLIYS